MVVIDSSAIVALLNAGEPAYGAMTAWARSERDRLITTPLIAAEVDYLALRRGGYGAARAFRDDLRDGVYELEWWSGATAEIANIADASGDLELGLADASLVALAARVGTGKIATLDYRHFRSLRRADNGEPFLLLPADGDR